MRVRIDFTVRELDVPEERARGVSFGDEVDAGRLRDFFDRCRDAVAALLGLGARAVDGPPAPPARVAPTVPHVRPMDPYVHRPGVYRYDRPDRQFDADAARRLMKAWGRVPTP